MGDYIWEKRWVIIGILAGIVGAVIAAIMYF